MLRRAERLRAWAVEEQLEAEAPSLREPVRKLEQLLDAVRDRVESHSELYGVQPLKRKAWRRKDAIGHLLDWATAHHHWFARAAADKRLVGAAYPAEEWAAAQPYNEVSWADLVAANYVEHCGDVIGQVLSHL